MGPIFIKRGALIIKMGPLFIKRGPLVIKWGPYYKKGALVLKIGA